MGFFDIAKRIGDSHGLSIPSYDSAPIFIERESPIIEKSQTWKPISDELKGMGVVVHDADYPSFIQTYGTVPWIYTAFWNIATSISSLTWGIYKVEGDTETELDANHPAIQLLTNPNPFDSWADVIEQTMIYLETTGNAYWELSQEQVSGYPIGLYVLETEKMYCVPDPIKKIRQYVYDPGTSSAKIIYDPSRIIHFKYANPSSPFYGQGTVKALQNTIITELNREMYTKSFLENEARPDVVIRHNTDTTKGIRPITTDDADVIKRKWQESFQGPRKNRKPIILGDGMEISTLTDQVQDMHYRELEKSLRERTLGGASVPPALVGLFEFANYANTREQIKIFWKVAIPPKLRTLIGGINRGLLKVVDRALEIRFDTDHIAALDEDPKDRSDRLLALMEHGVYNRNEIRRELGEDNIDDTVDKNGDAYVIMSSLVPTEDVFNPVPNDTASPFGGGLPGEVKPPVKMPELPAPNTLANLGKSATEPYNVIVQIPANPIHVETPTVNVMLPVAKKMKKIPIRDSVTGLIKEIREVEDE